ncbi:MAG: SURF1 family protein [Thalassospira sp.]|nr:SURF1 family protein [Thalassospira sp.]
MRVKKILIGLVVAAAFFTLCGLCIWQVQRLAWKEALIEQLAANSTLPPLSIEQALDLPEEGYTYRRVVLTGTWAADKAFLVGLRQQDGQRGYLAVAPLKVTDAGYYTGRYAVVVLGFVPYEQASAWRFQGGEGDYTALILPPNKPTMFTPTNDPARGIWHHLFVDEIAAALTLKPFFPMPMQLAAPPEGSGLRALPAAPELRNEHLQYALTWGFLAAGLFVYLVLLARRKAV